MERVEEDILHHSFLSVAFFMFQDISQATCLRELLVISEGSSSWLILVWKEWICVQLTRQLYRVVLLTFIKVGRRAVVIGIGAVGVSLETRGSAIITWDILCSERLCDCRVRGGAANWTNITGYHFDSVPVSCIKIINFTTSKRFSRKILCVYSIFRLAVSWQFVQ